MSAVYLSDLDWQYYCLWSLSTHKDPLEDAERTQHEAPVILLIKILGCGSQPSNCWLVYNSIVQPKRMLTYKHWLSLTHTHSVPRLMGYGGHGGDDSAKVLRYFCGRSWWAAPIWVGMSTRSLTSSTRHFLSRPQRRPSSKVPWRMVLEKLKTPQPWCNPLCLTGLKAPTN